MTEQSSVIGVTSTKFPFPAVMKPSNCPRELNSPPPELPWPAAAVVTIFFDVTPAISPRVVTLGTPPALPTATTVSPSLGVGTSK